MSKTPSAPSQPLALSSLTSHLRHSTVWDYDVGNGRFCVI